MKERISLEEAKESIIGTKYELIEVCPELEFYRIMEGAHTMICAECCFERMDRERREQNRYLGKEKEWIASYRVCPRADSHCYVIRDKTI